MNPMASVVFMRGVNVGGHKAFRPSLVAGRLRSLDVISIGAAGTFVVQADADEAKIRSQFLKQIPFETQLMICPARDITSLVALDPFADKSLPPSDGQFVTIVERVPRKLPKLPLEIPEGGPWQVRWIAIHRRCVATLRRNVGRTPLYPNEAIERRLGVAATTRNWATILKVHRVLC